MAELKTVFIGPGDNKNEMKLVTVPSSYQLRSIYLNFAASRLIKDFITDDMATIVIFLSYIFLPTLTMY